MGEGRTFWRVVKTTRIAKGISRKKLSDMTRERGCYVSARQLERIEIGEIDSRLSEVKVLVDCLQLRTKLRLSDLIG